jgi:hypothetical protein
LFSKKKRFFVFYLREVFRGKTFSGFIYFLGVYTLKQEIKGKSRAIPLRLNAENDAYVKRFFLERKYASMNFALNKLIEEHRLMIQKYRGRAKEKILELMRDYDIKLSEL